MGEDEKYEKITKCMKEAVLVASGKRINDNRDKNSRPHHFKNPMEWWDAECAEKIRDRIEARKAYVHIRNLATKINYKRCIAIARKTTKQKKRILRNLRLV